MVGYRYFLDQMIEESGCHADFVGALDWNWNEAVRAYPDWTDRQHDGLSAWSLFHLKTYVAQDRQTIDSPTGNRPGFDMAQAAGADVALTNGSIDVTQDGHMTGMTALESAEWRAQWNTLDMTQLIADIAAASNEGTQVHLAQIINSHRPSSAPVPPLDTPRMINDYINAGYADLAAADPSIQLVDMATGYDPEWNLDAIHPGNLGAEVMAYRWHQALAAEGPLAGCLSAAPAPVDPTPPTTIPGPTTTVATTSTTMPVDLNP